MGLMVGLVPNNAEPTVLPLVARLMARGYLTLPAGSNAEVLQLVPPLTIAEDLLKPFAEVLKEEVG